jgi:hypothetical protein
VASYLARTAPDDYTSARAEVGPLVWRGDIPDLYIVRDAILKSPNDLIPVTFEYEPPRKGEIDILVAVDTAGELPDEAPDVLRSIAFALLSLLNLRLGDFLAPCAPLQISRAGREGRQINSTVSVAVENRDTLSVTAIQEVVREFFEKVLRGSTAKIQTALELYGSSFVERSAKTRFLLLVTAMEVLAPSTLKHAAALRLLEKWQIELTEQKGRLATSTPEFAALAALERELLFRKEDSIRSQVRRLMARVSASHPSVPADLPSRAVNVYDKRSQLVHDGAIPSAELVGLEAEARELLEAAFRFLLSETKKQEVAG